jgi:hypothetical protein
MGSMIRDGDRKALALTLAALVLAVGFCVFDGDGHHENAHAGFDLCLGMLAVAVTITLLSRLPLAGSADVDRLAPVLELSLRVPVPPPSPTFPSSLVRFPEMSWLALVAWCARRIKRASRGGITTLSRAARPFSSGYGLGPDNPQEQGGSDEAIVQDTGTVVVK